MLRRDTAGLSVNMFSQKVRLPPEDLRRKLNLDSFVKRKKVGGRVNPCKPLPFLVFH